MKYTKGNSIIIGRNFIVVSRKENYNPITLEIVLSFQTATMDLVCFPLSLAHGSLDYECRFGECVVRRK